MGARFGSKLYCAAPGDYHFFCPGCGIQHRFTTSESSYSVQWSWNGNGDHPTVTPSIKVQYGIGGRVCHMYITDGFIEYLPDSYHYLSGKTVQMMDWLEEDFET